jgi:hypothetical protein
MKLSLYAKKEEIGNPNLFCGREKELTNILEWVDLIPQEGAKSRALLATKKMGKTALLERLYNILFQRGMETERHSDTKLMIPFYFRIKEQKMTQMAFAKRFYFSFLSQYVAFVCRKPEWVNDMLAFPELVAIAKEHRLEGLQTDLEQYEWYAQENSSSIVWEFASEAPQRIGARTNECFLQILDEFQYLNRYIFSDNPPYDQIDLGRYVPPYFRIKSSPAVD